MFGVVSRLRQVRSKALPCILSYTILKAGAFILAQRSMETTLAPARFYRVEKQLTNLVMPHDKIVRQRW